MARKKGSMSLKDFHGGEIRSDLPLPSKPGVTTEPSIKSSFGGERGYTDPSRERFVPSYGRSDTRTPPHSDRSYFPDPSSIGKNYEEDERKPVGAKPSGPFSSGAPAYPSHLVTERFPPSGGGYSSRLADLPSTPPQKQEPQNSPPRADQRPKLQLQPRSRSFDDDDSNDVSITPGVQVLTIGRNAFKESEVKNGGEELEGGVENGEEERPRERPKLNLKPRSQEGVGRVEEGQSRPGVFGGARPRDVVLKERGVDEAVIIGIEDKRAIESPKKEATPVRVGSPDQSKWGKLGEKPREDRYVRADDHRRPGGRDSDPRENDPARNGWGDKPGFTDWGFRGNGRPENGFERQGSGGFARSGSFGDNRGGQWRAPKPASPPIRSALVDTSVKKDPWEAPLTSLQLAEAFSRSTSSGSPGQGRGPAGLARGSPVFGSGASGRGNDRFAWGGASLMGGRGAGSDFGAGRGNSSFGRDRYRRNEHEYRGPPRSSVYQDDERG